METKILMVCLGNICRSPLAEVLLRTKALQAGHHMYIDSAGLHHFHEGENPDPRSIQNAKHNGVDIASVISRPVNERDFEMFDLLFSMDESVHQQLLKLAKPAYRHKLHLFLPYCGSHLRDVPDPYYGTEKDFQKVFDLLNDATSRLIQKLQMQLN